MFQSIEYTNYIGYNATTKFYSYEYELVDSDFSCVAITLAASFSGTVVGVVIQEYSKRKLNVAANLIRYFKYREKSHGYSIAQQIAWAEEYQPLFTPEIKADLQKYLTLL